MKTRMVALVVVSALSWTALACPMCKDSVPNKENAATIRFSNATESQNISGGINASIYFMLAGLVGVMGLVSMVVVKGVRGNAPRRGFEMKPRGDENVG